tara:strand:- start:224 stop:427 length:204 start_codon:yes stop_codon:yes gene_type:complete
MKTFNRHKLKENIQKSGLKVGYISDQLGMHRTTLSYYMSGRRSPGHEVLKKISKLIKCKIGDLYGQE